MKGAFSVKYRTKTIQVAKPLQASDGCPDMNFRPQFVDCSVIIRIFVVRMSDSWQEIKRLLARDIIDKILKTNHLHSL